MSTGFWRGAGDFVKVFCGLAWAGPVRSNARRALKVSVKPFQRLAGSKGRALGRSPQGAKGPGAAMTVAGLVPKGAAPAGGTPPSTAVDTSPFRGGRPKSRLRRLAVGAASQPFGGTIYGRFTAGLLPKSVGPAVLSGRQAAVQKQRRNGEDGANRRSAPT